MYRRKPNRATSTGDNSSPNVTAIGAIPHRQYWHESGTSRVLAVPATITVWLDGTAASVDTEHLQPLSDADEGYIGWLPEGHDPRSSWYGMLPPDTEIVTVDVSRPGATGEAA